MTKVNDKPVSYTHLKELKCLDEIAHNMWWAWNYEGRDLLKSLDADLYEKCNANPVLLLSLIHIFRVCTALCFC